MPIEHIQNRLTKEQASVVTFMLPTAKVGDLSHPQRLLSSIMREYYSSLEAGSVDSVLIEDVSVEITNPRNMLNVLLYLSEALKVSTFETLRIYFLELIDRRDIELLKEIVYEEKILEVCGVSTELLLQTVVKEAEKSTYKWAGIEPVSFEDVISLIVE